MAEEEKKGGKDEVLSDKSGHTLSLNKDEMEILKAKFKEHSIPYS